jgi:hypothetical protein
MIKISYVKVILDQFLKSLNIENVLLKGLINSLKFCFNLKILLVWKTLSSTRLILSWFRLRVLRPTGITPPQTLVVLANK